METILEISSSNADIVSNTSLTTVFNPPINITAPSDLTFSQGFIDLRALGNSGTDSFVLDTPININLTFAYYEFFLEQFETKSKHTYNERLRLSDGKAVDNTENFAGKLYMAYKVTYQDGHTPTEVMMNEDTLIDKLEVITDEFGFLLPAGIYTADTLIEFMNEKFQNQFFTDGEFFDSDLIDYGNTKNSLYTNFLSQTNKNTTLVPNTNPPQYKTAIVFLAVDSNPISFDYKTKDIGYTYRQKAPPTTDSLERTSADFMMGCPITTLQNVDDIISFGFLHNPIYQIDKTTGDRTQFLQLINFTKEATVKNYFQYARGGICLTALNPSSFWEDLLGFTDTSIFLRIDSAPAIELTNENSQFINITGEGSVSRSTTRPFIGVSTIDEYFNQDTVKEEILTTEYLINEDTFRALTISDTVSINATQPIQFAQFNSNGHFLITIDIGYYINNYYGAKLKKNITCIASREYLTNGFLSILQGGTPIFLEAGSVISYIKLDIIDPITKLPATNIGSNNSFYLSLSPQSAQ